MQVSPKPESRVPLAVLGAAMGIIVAFVCVAALSMVSLSINGGVVGAIAGSVAGAATAVLGATDRIE